MSRPRDEQYAKMLQSHVLDPGNLTVAAAEAKCSWRSAKAAWESGWHGRPPIRDVIADRQRLRRGLVGEAVEAQRAAAAKLQAEVGETSAGAEAAVLRLQEQVAELRGLVRCSTAEAEKQRDRLYIDADVDGRVTREAELAQVRASRDAVQGLLVALQRLEANGCLSSLGDRIAAGLGDGSVSAKVAAYMLASFGKMARDLADGCRLVAENERRLVGDPTHVIRHEHAAAPMSAHEFARQLAVLNRHHAAEIEYQDAVIEALPAPAPEHTLGDEDDAASSASWALPL